mgnify:CR=1 FL=1
MASHTSAINEHLALEFQASHTYLAMSIWLRERDLIGFSSYMLNKSTEERGHASKFIAYLVDSECNVQLPTIESPEREWQSVKTLFDKVYEMEKLSPSRSIIFIRFRKMKGIGLPQPCSIGLWVSSCRKNPKLDLF